MTGLKLLTVYITFHANNKNLIDNWTTSQMSWEHCHSSLVMSFSSNMDTPLNQISALKAWRSLSNCWTIIPATLWHSLQHCHYLDPKWLVGTDSIWKMTLSLCTSQNWVIEQRYSLSWWLYHIQCLCHDPGRIKVSTLFSVSVENFLFSLEAWTCWTRFLLIKWKVLLFAF